MLLNNSRCPTHVPKRLGFSGTSCKICVLEKFGFWKTDFVSLYNSSNTFKKHLYYVNIQFSCPTYVLEKSVFSGGSYKIYVSATFGIWENGLSGLVEFIKYKQKHLNYVIIQFMKPYTCARIVYFLRGLVVAKFWFWEKWLCKLVKLIKYKINIYIILLYNSRRPTAWKVSFFAG